VDDDDDDDVESDECPDLSLKKKVTSATRHFLRAFNSKFL